MLNEWLCTSDVMGADAGDSVQVDEPIAQIETDKVQILKWYLSAVIGGF